MRCFLALPLPDEVRRRLASLQADLRRRLRGGRWVPPADLHLTLRFYGELAPEQVQRLLAGLRAALAGAGPFPVSLRGVGGFPSTQRARVVWVGVAEGAERLRALHVQAERAPAGMGLPPEGRPYVPHVTLVRLREPQVLPDVGEAELGRFTASEAVLYESRLTPRGAAYREIARLSLQGDGQAGILELEE